MLVLDNGDKLQGDTTTASKVDFTIHGVVGTTITQLADGQLASSKGDLYTSSADSTVVAAITLVNTNTSAEAINLYLLPSGGTARKILPQDLSLGIDYSLIFDGNRIAIFDDSGRILQSCAGLIKADGSVAFSGSTGVNDDVFFKFGGAAFLGWETADANANALILALPDGGATDVPVFVIGDQSILNADLGEFNGYTAPTVVIYNALGDAYAALGSGDSVDTSYGVYFSPATDEDVNILFIGVSGSPTIFWDESLNRFSFNKGIAVTSGGIAIGVNAVLHTGNVDDTPVNGATAAPVSSNWAYDHVATGAHSYTIWDAGVVSEETAPDNARLIFSSGDST